MTSNEVLASREVVIKGGRGRLKKETRYKVEVRGYRFEDGHVELCYDGYVETVQGGWTELRCITDQQIARFPKRLARAGTTLVRKVREEGFNPTLLTFDTNQSVNSGL